MPQQLYHPRFDKLTLYDSFQEEVLLLTPRSNLLKVPNIDMTKKGLSTQEAVPPIIWFPRDIREYLQRGEDIRKRHRKDLEASYLPAPYMPCVLNSETDVVQASVLWLLHPVIKALQAEFPNVQCAAEVTLEDCRCDALISIGGQPIAVLEYKNRGNLKKLEFDAGKIVNHTQANRQEILHHLAKGADSKNKSNMAHNAVCLTKQAAAYAIKWETRFVALFDWDGLFLWHFGGMNLEPPLPGRGNSSRGRNGHATWAWGTWVDSRAEYRRALLGFVMAALRDKHQPNFRRNGEQAPWEPTRMQKQKQREENEAKRLQQMTPTQRANQQLYSRRG